VITLISTSSHYEFLKNDNYKSHHVSKFPFSSGKYIPGNIIYALFSFCHETVKFFIASSKLDCLGSKPILSAIKKVIL